MRLLTLTLQADGMAIVPSHFYEIVGHGKI
jgi:hypothetical protein